MRTNNKKMRSKITRPPLPRGWQHVVKAFSCLDAAEQDRHFEEAHRYFQENPW